MRRKAVPQLVALMFGLAALTGNAAVTELWRTGFTNSFTNFFGDLFDLTGAAADAQGNTIVGGRSGPSPLTGLGSAFLAKFDASGNKLWEFRTETNAFLSGIDALAVDSEGDIAATVRFNPQTNSSLAVIKLSASGRELWRVIETNVVSVSSRGFFPSAVQMDSRDNVVVTALTTRQLGPGTFATEQFVAKFNEDGRPLWRTLLPGYGYVLFTAPYADTLAITDKDEVLVVGGYHGSHYPGGTYDSHAFVAKLDKRGRLEWWTQQPSGPSFYSSVMANRKGTIAVGGVWESGATFSRRGELQQVHPDLKTIFGLTDEGGFVGMCGNRPCLLDDKGSELWRFSHYLLQFWGAVPDGDGAIAVGASGTIPGATIIRFIGIDSQGHELWRTDVTGMPIIKPVDTVPEVFVIRAPDGTIRIVGPRDPGLNPYFSRGIAIMAFALEPE